MRSAPDYIQFYPTIRCNLACTFCYNHALPKMKDMAFADFKRMLDRLKSIGIRTLDIIGGEPTLHEELERFLKYALQEGIGINLSSNCTDRLQVAGIMEKYPRVKMGISVNDRKAAQDLEDLIKKRRPLVKMVAGKRLDDSLIKYLLSLNPKKFFLLYRDAMTPEQLQDTVPFDDFWSFVQSAYDPERVGTVSCSGFLPEHKQYPELLQARCPAGTTKLAIMPDGSVYPCNLFFGFDEFRLGNILTDPFEVIWGNRQLTFFRTFTGNKCPRRSCVLHTRCHGGCPAHSYAHTGKRSSPEPRCVPPE